MLKRILKAPAVQRGLGRVAAGYLKSVQLTSDFVATPDNIYDLLDRDAPVILSMWHGQHFLAPFVRRPTDKAAVLVSRHRDGEINAVAAEILGVSTIRGSGDPKGRFDKKGGVGAFKTMIDTLGQGINVALTADVPKISRKVGLGIVTLARYSGRPIYPLGIGTSRAIRLNNWDRSTIGLPFSTVAYAVGELIHVAPDADDAAMQAARQALQTQMEWAEAAAQAMAEGRIVPPKEPRP